MYIHTRQWGQRAYTPGPALLSSSMSLHHTPTLCSLMLLEPVVECFPLSGSVYVLKSGTVCAGYEHFILRDILAGGLEMLPTQILVSLHSFQEDHFHQSKKSFSRHHMVQFFQYMYEKGGYHVIAEDTADDCFGNDCIQLLFAVVECHPHKHTKLEKSDLHKAELQVRINFLLSERFPHLKY